MPLLHHPVALDELYRMAPLREAWTDIGDFGVVRRAGLRKIDNFSQALSHPGADPATDGRATMLNHVKVYGCIGSAVVPPVRKARASG